MEKREVVSFDEAYEKRQEILAHPELYSNVITVFSAGDGCYYSTNYRISVAQLVRCWQYEVYQVKCPKCGGVAYVTKWIGNTESQCNGKLYREVRAYCPHCRTNDYIKATELKVPWKDMLKCVEKITEALDWQKFADAYNNMHDILEHPEQYTEKITHFSAGGLGACVYSHDVSVAELVRCWQREEYRVECPKCKSEAYIVAWAGHVNAGGYWSVRVFCPHCKNEYKISGIGLASWRRMREISNEVTKELNTNN